MVLPPAEEAAKAGLGLAVGLELEGEREDEGSTVGGLPALFGLSRSCPETPWP